MTWISTPRGLYGESGIRTHGTLTSTHAFQACTLGHSVISPAPRMEQGRLRTGMYRQTPQRHGWSKGGCVQGCTGRRPSAMDGARAAAQAPPWCIKIASGESGIRTHGAASGSTVFETARFDRSRISPSARTARARLRTRMYKQTRIQPRMGRGRRSTVTYQSRPSSTDGARGSKTTRGRPPASSRGRRPSSSCPRGFEPPTFRSAV